MNLVVSTSYRILLTLVAISLAACSSGPLGAIGGVFGKSEEEKIEEEEAKQAEEDDRISILAFEDSLQADPRYAGAGVDLPPSYKNISWPQPGGEADHTLHHLSGDIGFDVLWREDIGAAASRRAKLTSPPVAADGRVYVVDAEATVGAYDAETGDEIWRAELAPELDDGFRITNLFFGGVDPAEIGFGGGVAYDGGRLFVTSGFRFLAGVDAEDGEELWRFETDAPIRTPPTAYRGAVYAVTITNEMIAVDQTSGEKLWSFSSFEENARILSSASPAAAGDLVVAPFSSGEVVAFLADSGRPVWNDTLSRSASLTALASLNDIAGSPVIDRGLVYVVSHAGQLTAIDIRTGDRVWETPIQGVQMPWVAGDYIFIVSVDAELVCLAREDGAVVWIAELDRFENEKKRKGRISWAGPILVGDHLFLVSTNGRVAKVDADNGEIVDRKKIGDGSIVPPIVADETLLVLTAEGDLIAMR
ncbi:MAG: PQQ-binding-like beta-propeller repeat protein [Parvularculaceae bacterium]